MSAAADSPTATPPQPPEIDIDPVNAPPPPQEPSWLTEDPIEPIEAPDTKPVVAAPAPASVAGARRPRATIVGKPRSGFPNVVAAAAGNPIAPARIATSPAPAVGSSELLVAIQNEREANESTLHKNDQLMRDIEVLRRDTSEMFNKIHSAMRTQVRDVQAAIEEHRGLMNESIEAYEKHITRLRAETDKAAAERRELEQLHREDMDRRQAEHRDREIAWSSDAKKRMSAWVEAANRAIEPLQQGVDDIIQRLGTATHTMGQLTRAIVGRKMLIPAVVAVAIAAVAGLTTGLVLSPKLATPETVNETEIGRRALDVYRAADPATRARLEKDLGLEPTTPKVDVKANPTR